MATITKLPSGKFKAIIRHRGLNKCKTFTRKGEAKAWADRIEKDREAMAALGTPGASMTFAQLADEYLEQWNGRDQSITFKVKFWHDTIGAYKLIEVDRRLVRNALDKYAVGAALRGDGVDKDGKPKLKNAGRMRSPATVNRMLSTLSAIFNYALDRELVEVGPDLKRLRRSENNKRRRYLSDDERKALLVACRTSQWDKLELLVTMALTTGARQGELLGLRWSDIDFKDGTANLARTKNGEPRVLTIPSPTLALLKKHREVSTRLVFPSELKPFRPFEFAKHWLKALEIAGIEDFRFHDLRHSAASYLAESGASLHEIADVLGHKSLESTKRYTHLSIKHKAALTERVFSGMLEDG